MPICTALKDLSFDDVKEGGKLNKSFIGTVQVNDVWYNLINIRHRNGYDDGEGVRKKIWADDDKPWNIKRCQKKRKLHNKISNCFS